MSNWKKIIVSGSHAHLSSVTASNGSIISGSLTMSGSITNVDNLNFYTTSSAAGAVGRFVWNDGDGTLDLGLKGGNVTLAVGEQTFARVYNGEGTTLNKGEVVYISGSQGNRILVKRADYSAEAGSSNTLGFVAETITSGAEGFVITNGVFGKLNTVGLTGGSLLYLSSSGQYTQTKTVAPQHTVILGYVERVHATVGSIYVKIDNGYELGELHNVLTNGVTNGDLLAYSGSIWKHTKQLSGSYGLTGSLQATSFTGSLQGSASYALQSLSASFATTASYVLGGGGGGGEVIIGGPTSTDWSEYTGTPNRYMLISDGVTNDITASHILQLDTSNESINIYAGIEGYNGASISLGTNAYVQAGYFYGTASIAVSSSFATTASYVLGGGGASVTSPGNNRLITSDGTSGGLVGETNLSFDGTLFSVTGSAIISATTRLTDVEERELTVVIGGTPTSLSLDLSQANVFEVSYNASVNTFSITNPPPTDYAGSFTLVTTGTGTPYPWNWGSAVTWSGGSAPSVTSTNGKKDIYGFITTNQGTNWYGFVGAQNL